MTKNQLWVTFHCIRKDKTDLFLCCEIENEKHIWNTELDGYIIPMCKYIPIVWREYYLKKFISRQHRVSICHQQKPLEIKPLEIKPTEIKPTEIKPTN